MEEKTKMGHLASVLSEWMGTVQSDFGKFMNILKPKTFFLFPLVLAFMWVKWIVLLFLLPLKWFVSVNKATEQN